MKHLSKHVISEIYAKGSNRTSAFVLVENGEMVNYGSYRWGDSVSYAGITAPPTDLNCEVIAVICALMICHRSGRPAVNIFVDDDGCQQRYFRRHCDSPFMSIFNRYASVIDVYADKPQYEYYVMPHHYVRNIFLDKLNGMI